MTADLTRIIEKIKTQGVQAAEEQARSIIQAAELDAREKLKEAEAKRQEILKQAERDAEKLIKNGEEALRQAARDVTLSLKARVTEMLDTVMRKEVSGVLTPEVLTTIILKLVDNFGAADNKRQEIILSDKDKEQLEKTAVKELKSALSRGAVLKASSKIEHGLRIGVADGNAYYDFTDDAILEALKAYVNPKISKILDEKA